MLEGPTNRSIWDWKATLGPLRHRKGFPGPWGYTVTQGLGHLEYLQWAEDMGMDIGMMILTPLHHTFLLEELYLIIQ